MLLLLAIVSFLPSSLKAYEVTHLVKPYSTFETASLKNSCSTIRGVNYSSNCNPALFPYSNQQGIAISIIGKSDGDSIDVGKELIFDPITEPLIRKLFEEKNYNSFTFNGNISFKTSLFEITYIPYYLMADLYIFNPSFPEISINLVSREVLQLTSGIEVGAITLGESSYSLSVGTNLFYYEHTYENTTFTLFDLGFQKPEELIVFKSKYGLSGDLGFLLSNDSAFVPDISIQFKNIESKVERNEARVRSAYQQESKYLFETYSSLGIGKKLETSYGGIGLNLEQPFIGYFEEYSTDDLSLGIHYDLKLFSIFLGISKQYKNIGMQFKSNTFNVGITYARENDTNRSGSKDENSVYTGIDINL